MTATAATAHKPGYLIVSSSQEISSHLGKMAGCYAWKGGERNIFSHHSKEVFLCLIARHSRNQIKLTAETQRTRSFWCSQPPDGVEVDCGASSSPRTTRLMPSRSTGTTEQAGRIRAPQRRQSTQRKNLRRNPRNHALVVQWPLSSVSIGRIRYDHDDRYDGSRSPF